MGFYFRAPLNPDPSTAGYVQPGIGYFFNAPMDFGDQNRQLPSGVFYSPPSSAAPVLNFPMPLPPPPYWYYNFGTIPGSMEPGLELSSSLRPDPDPFRRWRRQAIMKALLVKCCAPSGCTALDFIRVDKEYNICEK